MLTTTLDLKSSEGREDVQLYSSHLQDWFSDDQIRFNRDEGDRLSIEWQVVSALEEWTKSSSQILCIVGPSDATAPSTTSLIAKECAVSANLSQIPVISFSCDLPRKNLTGGVTAEVRALIALTYALIRQLIGLLPTTFTCTENLREPKFAVLDGSLDTWSDAMAVIGELLDLAPPMLFCVINDFQLLDDKSTSQYLEAFLDTMRGHTKIGGSSSEGPKRVLKILFTTAGSSRCLLSHLTRKELVFAEHNRTARRPGKAMIGQRSLSPTALKELRERGVDD